MTSEQSSTTTTSDQTTTSIQKAQAPSKYTLGTKLAEVRLLEAFVSRIPDDAYLMKFFSTDLLGWVKAQILSDHFPDLFGVVAKLRFDLQLREGQLNASLNRGKVLDDTVNKLMSEKMAMRHQIEEAQTEQREWEAYAVELEDLLREHGIEIYLKSPNATGAKAVVETEVENA